MNFVKSISFASIFALILLSQGPQKALADFSCMPADSSGTDVSIALDDDALPASDLSCDAACLSALGNKNAVPHILDPEEAMNDRRRQGLDLSQLSPDPSTDIWKPTPSSDGEALDAAIAINSNDPVQYQADICSSAGRYRFNARTNNGQTITIMLSRSLHTFLLRKELLRKLGYTIPGMKWLPKVIVHFPTLKIRDNVLNNWLPFAADGATTRWCATSDSVLKANKDIPCTSLPDAVLGGDPLTVQLQDVMAMDATPLYYNTAIGPPIVQLPNSSRLRAEQYRTLRALSIIYDLADIPESINQLDWYAARILNNGVFFHIDDQANFGTTLDDALWITRKIGQLTRDDFEGPHGIVTNAHYPPAVAQLLTEKLLARRNSLLVALGIKEISELPVKDKINPGPGVVNGKVVQKVWDGYASDFSGTDPVNPLTGIWWYILSEVETNAMEALVATANQEIPSLSTADAYASHAADVQKQLANAIISGQSSSVGFRAWTKPVVNGSVQFSRSVVLGQYLGTNNLVQLADTFGFTVNAGIIVGFDGMPAAMSAEGQASGSASISLTHLKPLSKLKQGVTEKVVKEIVPWVFGKSSAVMKAISDAQSQMVTGVKETSDTDKAIDNTLTEELSSLQNYLGIGESLILTTSLSGLEQLGVGYSLPTKLSPALSLTGEMNELRLSRVQFYRRDENTIVVYKDNGQLIGPTLSFEFTFGSAVSFPVIQINATGVSGSGSSHVFNVDLTPNVKENPAVFQNAAALSKCFSSGSTAPLVDNLKQHPIILETKFTDESSSFQFFHYFSRGLKTSSDVRITIPDGFSQSYVQLNDGHQTGTSYQALATEAATFLLQKFGASSIYSIDTQTNPNPGQSFYGKSQTRNASFEGVLDKPATSDKPSSLDQPYVNIAYRWEGWDINAADIIKLNAEQSEKYGFLLYDDHFLGDTKDIKMYEILLGINIYQAGLGQIMSMSEADESALLDRYRQIHQCAADEVDNDDDSARASQTNADFDACSAMHTFKTGFKQYRAALKANADNAQPIHGLAGILNGMLNIFHLGKEVPVDGEKLSSIIFKISNALERFASFEDLTKLVGGKDNLLVCANITGFKSGSELSSNQGLPSNCFGKPDPNNPSATPGPISGGPLTTAAGLVNIPSGEFNLSWLRSVL